MEGKAGTVRGIAVRGPYTLELTLERPFAPFLALLAYPAASVVPREAVEQWGRQFSRRPVGTGPFRFREWRHDDRVVVDANRDYFQGSPHLDQIVFRIIPDDMTRLQEFKAGNLDHTDVPTGLFRMIQHDPSLGSMLVSRSSLGINAVQFNLERSPFRDNRKLRQAFNYAVDKAAVAQVILEGRVRPARSVLPPGILGHDAELTGYPYDKAKAKHLLAEAGYEGGRGLPPLTLHYNTGLVNRKIAEFVQGALREIGVTIALRELDWPAYLNFVDSGEVQLFRLGWLADYPDPENFLTVLFHSRNIGSKGNLSRYTNPRVDALLDQADETLDTGERARLYREAGADCVFPIALRERAALSTFVAEAGGPVNALASAHSPSLAELAELGVARVSWGSLLHRDMIERFRRALVDRDRLELRRRPLPARRAGRGRT